LLKNYTKFEHSVSDISRKKQLFVWFWDTGH